MTMSHMETEGQRWPNVPNVTLGEPVDVSSAFNYGFSGAMMNNLWVYDFNMLEESQNHLISGLPVQESPVCAISDPALSFSRLLANMEHNRENDDPNTVKVANFIESKVTQKCVKGPRSKRCKRTAFESPWMQKDQNLYGSVDNQETGLGEPFSEKKKGQNLHGSVDNQGSDLNEPTFKKQKDQNLYGSVDNKKTGLGEPISEKKKGQNLHGSVDNQGSDLNEPTFKKRKGQNLYRSVDDQGSGLSEPRLNLKKQKGHNLESNDIVSESVSVNGVGRWLEDLGFGRYTSMFEMHEVDEEALPLLTLDDLKEMGILAVGSRRKLFAAICRLKGK